MTFASSQPPGQSAEGTSPVRLAEESTGTGASVQCTFRLQLPGDEVQQLAGRVMAEFPFHRQECAHREQQAWSRPGVIVKTGTETGARLLSPLSPM